MRAKVAEVLNLSDSHTNVSSMGKRHTLPDGNQLVALVKEHGTMVAVSAHLGVPDQTLHSHVRKLMLQGDTDLYDRIKEARKQSQAKGKPSATLIDYPEPADLAEQISNAPTLGALADSLGASITALRNHAKRVGIDVKALREGDTTKIDGDRARLTASELKTAEELMAERGLSTDDWRVDRLKLNEWGENPSTGEPYKQMTVHLVRKPDLQMLFPAADAPKLKPPKIRRASKTKPQLWALVSDHQAPLHDEGAHQSFLRWLSAVKPDCGIHLGDLVDFSNVSRFGDSGDRRYNADVQTCINAGYRILSEIVQASPSTRWHFMLGNHDERLRREALTRSERLWGIRPADVPGADTEDDALSIRRLLRLDELGIICVDEPAGYQHNRVRIGDDFEVRHGMFTGQNVSKRTMDTLQASVAVGHTHAKSVAYRTFFDRDGVVRVAQGAEIGHMAQHTLGYDNGRADWHPGWATVTLFPDGQTNLEHVVYDEKRGKAVWRGQQF